MAEYDPSNPYTLPPRGWEDAEQLERAYWDYYWSTQEIAEWVGSDGGSIFNLLEEHDIPLRSNSESQTVRWMKERGASLEAISKEVPHPDSRAAGETSESTDLPWSDYDG